MKLFYPIVLVNLAIFGCQGPDNECDNSNTYTVDTSSVIVLPQDTTSDTDTTSNNTCPAADSIVFCREYSMDSKILGYNTANQHNWLAIATANMLRVVDYNSSQVISQLPIDIWFNSEVLFDSFDELVAIAANKVYIFESTNWTFVRKISTYGATPFFSMSASFHPSVKLLSIAGCAENEWEHGGVSCVRYTVSILNSSNWEYLKSFDATNGYFLGNNLDFFIKWDKIYQIGSWNLIRTLKRGGSISPKANFILTNHEIYDYYTEELLYSIADTMQNFCFYNDDSKLLYQKGNKLEFLDLSSKTIIHEFPIPTDSITGIKLDRDNKNMFILANTKVIQYVLPDWLR